MTDIKVSLKVIQDKAEECKDCNLISSRNKLVFGRGNPGAKILILGEAPGAEESEVGLPFVGRSGKLLDAAIVNCGFDSAKDVYITNTVLCRPPNNRKPTECEVVSCRKFLSKQLEIINPKIIITLGATAFNSMIKQSLGITKIRGQEFVYESYIIIPLFHPSYVLRNGGLNSAVGKTFQEDLKSIFNKNNK